jgi:zinc protease
LNAPLRVPREDRTAPRRLPNGLHYIVRRETASPTVVVSGTIRNNPALYEPKGKDGVSLILIAMLPWGTTTFDRKAYEAQFDAIAGSATLGTSFSLRVQAKDFERGMALLADGMLHPAFSDAAFGVVKSATTQSVALSNKLPAAQANLAQRLALYPPGDPRRRDVTEETVTSIRLDDVRHYYRSTFRPDETTIAVVGDVTPERARAALESNFGSWKSDGPAPSFRFPRLHPQAHAARTVRVKSANSAQSEVTLKEVFPMTRADPDYVPLLLANTILSGEGTGSLLVEELRTRRGFVYSAQSDFHVDPTGAEFDVSYASDPKNVAHTDAAIIAIVKQLQRTPLPENDLSRAKALLLAQRVLPLDSYTGIAADLLSGAQYGDLSAESEAAFWTALVRTTPLQLRNAMRRLDPDHFLRIIIEPDR